VADGPGRCVWPLEAEGPQALAMALVWLPRGAGYRVEGPPELLEFLTSHSARLVAAVASAG